VYSYRFAFIREELFIAYNVIKGMVLITRESFASSGALITRFIYKDDIFLIYIKNKEYIMNKIILYFCINVDAFHLNELPISL